MKGVLFAGVENIHSKGDSSLWATAVMKIKLNATAITARAVMLDSYTLLIILLWLFYLFTNIFYKNLFFNRTHKFPTQL